MSLKSWMKQYYPVPANQVKDELAAIRHSLRKWKGLTARNLTKHKMECYSDGGACIYEMSDAYTHFYIDDESCALCCLFGEKGCTSCPLYMHLKKRCDSFNTTSKEMRGPYCVFDDNHDPKPMIKALTAVLKKAAKKRKSK